jgi:hypothetical protein
MYYLFSMTTNQEAVRRLFRVVVDNTGNVPPLPRVYPDYPAPCGTLPSELAMARWGMPTRPKFLEGRKSDSGRYQHPQRCVVSLASLEPLSRPIHQLRRAR